MHLAAFAFMVIAGTGGICNINLQWVWNFLSMICFSTTSVSVFPTFLFLRGFDTRTLWKVQPWVKNYILLINLLKKIVEMANWFHLFIYRIKPRAGIIKTKESRDRGLKNIADFSFVYILLEIIELNLISILRYSFKITSEFIWNEFRIYNPLLSLIYYVYKIYFFRWSIMRWP